MTTYRLAQILLAMDAGATWSCLVLFAAAWRERGAPAADAPALEPWPVTPVTDPWSEHPITASWEPLMVTDTSPPAPPPPVLPPPWNRPTSALPRLETRRALHPRNLAPAAAEPPRYVELLLTRRAG